MSFDDCKFNPVPGCPNRNGSNGVYVPASVESSPEMKVTGEVCAIADVERTVTTRQVFDRAHGEVNDVPVPPYTVYEEIPDCVDVYNDDIVEADARLRKELDGFARGGKVVGYRTPTNCPGPVGFLGLWMASIFGSTALEHSERYCNKVGDVAEPEANDTNTSSLREYMSVRNETKMFFRKQCFDDRSFIGCFDLASLQ